MKYRNKIPTNGFPTNTVWIPIGAGRFAPENDSTKKNSLGSEYMCSPFFEPIEDTGIDAIIDKWEGYDERGINDATHAVLIEDLKTLKEAHEKELKTMQECIDYGRQKISVLTNELKDALKANGEIEKDRDQYWESLAEINKQVNELSDFFDKQIGFHEDRIVANLPDMNDDPIIVNLHRSLLHMVELCQENFKRIFNIESP